MKVLSFDVGIKNLAYCVIDDKNMTIDDWNILNISPEPVCEHHMKSGRCDKSAKFVIQDAGDKRLCPCHQKLQMYQGTTCKKIPKTKNPTLAIGKNIVRLLDLNPHLVEVDVVLIENQPALKNPTMKSIQMLVYGYFLVKGVSVESPLENIEMVNARNKLKAYQGPEIPCEIKDKYKRTKYLGIRYCEQMIHENKAISDKWRDIFKASKKKDDLSDAYLQGMYWLGK